MERKVLQGEDIVILVDEKEILHASDHSLKVDLELKEFRSKNTNGKEKSPGDVSWSADVNAFVVIDPDFEDDHTSGDVLKMLLDKKLVKVRLKANINGAIGIYEGSAYVTSFNLTTPAGDNATYSATLTGSGDLKETIS